MKFNEASTIVRSAFVAKALLEGWQIHPANAIPSNVPSNGLVASLVVTPGEVVVQKAGGRRVDSLDVVAEFRSFELDAAVNAASEWAQSIDGKRIEGVGFGVGVAEYEADDSPTTLKVFSFVHAAQYAGAIN